MYIHVRVYYTCSCSYSDIYDCFTVQKKKAVASLLDNTRSRNIEIFLPSFPLEVHSLDTLLDQQLNVISNSTELSVEHIVALKRCVYKLCIPASVHVFMHYYVQQITAYVIIVFWRFQPTQEEREMYKNYTGDKNLLPLADIFLLKVCVSIFLWIYIHTLMQSVYMSYYVDNNIKWAHYMNLNTHTRVCGTSYTCTLCTYMYMCIWSQQLLCMYIYIFADIYLAEQDWKRSPHTCLFPVFAGSYVTLLRFKIISCDWG